MKAYSAKRVAFMGLLFSLSIVLSFLESMIPTAGFLPAGVKLGLSNIITMYAVFFLGYGEAYCVAVLKSLFVLITRGALAALLSLSGGLLSVTIMLLLLLLFKKMSYITVSIFGAVAHNIGQITVMSFILGTAALYYLPVLIISGVVMGIITGIILKIVLPALDKLKSKL